MSFGRNSPDVRGEQDADSQRPQRKHLCDAGQEDNHEDGAGRVIYIFVDIVVPGIDAM